MDKDVVHVYIYIKWINNMVLLYNTENHIQYPMISHNGKEYIKAVYCHPTYLTYMHSTSCEMPGWMKHKLESRLLGEISITSDTQMTSPLWQKMKRN